MTLTVWHQSRWSKLPVYDYEINVGVKNRIFLTQSLIDLTLIKKRIGYFLAQKLI